uniref:Uncharacterized protein n=1 Tax=Tetraselmis sp. GSL018 TaxID=582737 RepID=A0A061QZW7_9CHLO
MSGSTPRSKVPRTEQLVQECKG